MFDFRLFGLLILASLPGIMLAVPRQLGSLRNQIALRSGLGADMPSPPVIIALGIVQNLVLVAIATALGVFLSPRVGLQAPFFQLLVATGASVSPSAGDLARIVMISCIGIALFLAGYYGLVRPGMDPDTIRKVEGIRIDLGLSARLLYGGITEEVLARWGLMTLFAWLGGFVFGPGSAPALWSAILLAGLLFGIGHLPAISVSGVRLSRFLVLATVVLNLWASIIFGWLFWQHGLYAAMLGHILFHLLWFPIDRRAYKKTLQAASELEA